MSFTPTSSGAQLPPSIDPFNAEQENDQATSLYNKEMAEFDSLAEQSAGLALIYFALVLCNTLLNWQGSGMNIESSLMDTISLLNSDLNKINSDINNIFEDLQQGDSTTSDIHTFINDTYQYAIDLDCYFDQGGTLAANGEKVKAPFTNSNLAQSVANDFQVFQVTYDDQGDKESLFQAFLKSSNGSQKVNWDDVTKSLATEFKDAYKGATNSGNSSEMKQIEDVVSNAETQQNQINSAAYTKLSADQQNFNSYEGTMKNILSSMITLVKAANSNMAQA